jgi:hypothetical protein
MRGAERGPREREREREASELITVGMFRQYGSWDVGFYYVQHLRPEWVEWSSRLVSHA